MFSVPWHNVSVKIKVQYSMCATELLKNEQLLILPPSMMIGASIKHGKSLNVCTNCKKVDTFVKWEGMDNSPCLLSVTTQIAKSSGCKRTVPNWETCAANGNTGRTVQIFQCQRFNWHNAFHWLGSVIQMYNWKECH